MSAYKKLNKQDAYITTYTAHKAWAVSGSELPLYNIDTALVTGSYLNKYQQLYYTTKTSGSISSHLFDFSNQTTLNYSQSRDLATGSFAIQFSPDVYGVSIKPNDGFSIIFSPDAIKGAAVLKEDYVKEGYVIEYAPILDGSKPVKPNPVKSKIMKIIDDGEGNLFISGSIPRDYVGDIVYNQGSVIITDVTYSSLFRLARTSTAWALVLFNWKSSLPIFTHNYHCKLRESEYNFTYNPSALSSSIKTVYDNSNSIYNISASVSDGYLNNNITGSEFQPYITTVGLYNDANQLIAVGKMSQPVPKSANTDMTIIVKIDI
jgi:hypothetical protein